MQTQLGIVCTLVLYGAALFQAVTTKQYRVVQGAVRVRGSYRGAVIHVIIIKHLHLSLSALDQCYNRN